MRVEVVSSDSQPLLQLLQRTAGDAAVQRRLFQAYWTTAPVLIGQNGAAGWSASLADTLPGPPSPAASGALHSL